MSSLNIYNITKSVKGSDQFGGAKLDDIIEKILDNEEIKDINLDEDDLNQLNKIESFKKLQTKQKDYIYNYLNEKIQKKKPTGKEALNPEKVAQYNEELKKLMEEARLERLEKLRLEGNKPNETVKLIEKEGRKRRETKTKFNSFGLTSNNRGKKRNPPKGGWV